MREQGTILIAFVIYAASCLIIWFFTIPTIGWYNNNLSNGLISGNSLDTHLAYAREQAIQRRQPITVCSSYDGFGCSGQAHWTKGWIVFTDSDGDPGQFSGDDELLFTYDAQDQELALKVQASYVRYLENGSIELN